jgi:tRNA-splicing ligase RtcB (3'-phosphate/5'-hydroxy nucleic acid ligase)
MLTTMIDSKSVDFDSLDRCIHNEIPCGFSIHGTEISMSRKIDLESLKCYSKLNLDRALLSMGTLGGGNHFIEIDKDEHGNIYLVVHSGSRNTGFQVAKHYQEIAANSSKDNVNLMIAEVIQKLKATGKRELIQEEIVKIKSEANKNTNDDFAYLKGCDLNNYIHDMKITQKYAEINRQVITDIIVKAMGWNVKEQFSTIHNYIDTDNMILRKGAVSARLNEILLIPINMRDGSLICKGKGNDDWNQSAPHGAGRLMSRTKANRSLTMDDFKEAMNGIYSSTVCEGTLDESPMAYKSMGDIVNNIESTAEILKVIKPIYNFKATS